MKKEIENPYDYLSDLNDQQLEAVRYIDGPQLVIAGAGSGKTRVLTKKIVHLIRSGMPAERILALTFTNKAAREMKSRMEPMIGARHSYRLWMGTFHSIFLRILRKHTDRIGFSPNFTIYDADDSKSLVKLIVKTMGLDDKTYKASTIANAISNAKNSLISAEQYLNDPKQREMDTKLKRPLTGQIYKAYVTRCKAANSMDFDDILYFTNILLRDNDDIRKHYADWFRYILVDEYQDTNFAQHLIVSQLLNEKGALCVVGDDAQSIYSFRGANIGNILTMDKRYPNLKTFKLERNYRSTQNIVNAAGSLIEKNTRQLRKNTFSENEEGEKVKLFRSYSDLEEASMVASLIFKSKNLHHDSFEDYAVLYRTNAQSRTLEEALRKKNIRYRIYGGLSFYQRKEIKDAISYFRVAVNPDDDEALKRIINYPARGIGKTTLDKLIAAAQNRNESLWKVLNNLDGAELNINSGTRKKLDSFTAMMAEFLKDNENATAYELGQFIYNRSGLLMAFSDEKTPEEISKKENLAELLSGLKEFVDLRTEEGIENVSMSAFLSEVSLATDQDREDEDNKPKVTLMTVHAAKGLEFKHVYIVGLEEELFPSALSMNSLREIEEERRLMYVAITRAEETCTITYSTSRFRNGQTMLTRPSRFLSEIDPKYIDRSSAGEMFFDFGGNRHTDPLANYRASLMEQKQNGKNKMKLNLDRSDTKELNSLADGSLSVGDRIEHNRFGIGIVKKLEDVSGEMIMSVEFVHIGIKKLLLKYAKFTKL